MTKHRIGIDLGGTKIEIVVLAPDGSERHRHRIETPHGYHASLEGIAGLVREAEAQLGITATVGIGIPGVISPVTGLVKNANSIALNGHAFDRDISALLGREVRVENDANCFALSEAVDGAGAGHGIGVRRHPRHRLRRRYRDRRQGTARTQPRHRRVGPQPAALATARRTARTALLVRPLGLPGDLDRRAGAGARLRRTGRARCFIGIPARAAAGDARAQAALDRHADRLARGLAQVVNLLDPDVIVLGGGLSNMDHLYTALPPLVRGYVFSDVVQTPIVRNRHGDSSGVRGAAWLWPAEG